ncbi:uncharacterized protein MYCFIDRAFT_47158 [Pseudocercospora fijiensis CIRAD86]|uniref:Ribosomal RNA methyltransferase FtsJ domain-containing protein n=1 Tax=Pseudocercospora fijiensis (strain CIRAD86) TaxID=383855 RepID=M2ZQ67_PSEFD|nr:uncharacterized protein MYCFIDRAFT_47158 [Pseudocercospora fijiensis CIRAD86]EME81209.1 hypothetical protein MYCFIDRAFT_47158 [Pseudocercospora fijiensis CIRAD86]
MQTKNEQNEGPASEVIDRFLAPRSAEYRALTEIRKKGWQSKEGDRFFEQQRFKADNADDQTENYLFGLMKHVGHQLQGATNAFTIGKKPSGTDCPHILDMCAAPGGFLLAALEQNPGSQALAFSLPTQAGGHKMLLGPRTSATITWADITMFAADMGVEDIPGSHPDHNNFLPRQLQDDQKFDLVMCDGQVLRTHSRAEYREQRETRRLSNTQLALGLEHINPGGTMIILLHKPEIWPTLHLLFEFSKFAEIQLFKPPKAHAKRSSFYLVATGIRTEMPEFHHLVAELKHVWKVATFGTDEEYSAAVRETDVGIENVLDQFGDRLIELATPLWKIQEQRLREASFNR